MDLDYMTTHSNAKQSKAKTFLLHGFYAFLLFLIVGAELLYRQPLIDWSVKEMRSIQND